jgi:hypothetical protein
MGEAKKKAMTEPKYQPGDAAMVLRSADALRAFSCPFCSALPLVEERPDLLGEDVDGVEDCRVGAVA